MRMLGSTKKEVVKDKVGQNVPKLESVEVAFVYCNLVKKIINTYQMFCLLLFQICNLDS